MSFLFAAAASFSERIKVNSMTREARDDGWLWIKRRRRSAPLTLACANHFFRLVGNRIHALADPSAWQHWEVECFLRLHGAQYRVFADGAHGVAAQEIPGTSLATFLDEGTFTAQMAAAAARELRRSHTLTCTTLGDWSHGDPHAGNFLYDAAEDRARLIDFEVVHDRAVPADDRHADDLLTFLQDMIGRVSASEWLVLANAFLDTYDRREVVARLVPRLILPRGLPRLWWAVRTTYLPGDELALRLELLRDALIQRGVTAQRQAAA